MRSALREAELRFGVPAGVVGAIMHVESQCGRNTGRRRVLPQLAKLAMANDPDNVRWNIDRHTDGVPARRRAAVEARVRGARPRARAHVLPGGDGDLPRRRPQRHRSARHHRLRRRRVRPDAVPAVQLPALRASTATAMAVVSLYDPDDAIASTANYLRGNGWRPGISYAEQRRVIWTYNHSDAYIDTVLQLADSLE